jgi:NAD(P)-dependent dehydrogenase (short-subunit alcohol dehydrogenase family)
MTRSEAGFEKTFLSRVAVVTGAGSGIGAGCARALAAAGAKVVVADRDRNGARRVVDDVRGAGGLAEAFVCDVSRDADVESLVAFVIETFGRLDLAVNNAGVNVPHAPLADGTERDWNHIISVDLDGVWRCLKHEIRSMLQTGGGAIVNMSSAAGIMGVQGAAAYCAAKHGVIGLTRVAALDYARHNIRVNAVCPGLIDTALSVEVLGDNVQAVVDANIPVGRIGRVSDIADAVTWLLSDRAQFVTGIALPVDGGGSITAA